MTPHTCPICSVASGDELTIWIHIQDDHTIRQLVEYLDRIHQRFEKAILEKFLLQY